MGRARGHGGESFNEGRLQGNCCVDPTERIDCFRLHSRPFLDNGKNENFGQLCPYHYNVGIKPCVEDTVDGVPKVLFGCCERGHTRQQKYRHL